MIWTLKRFLNTEPTSQKLEQSTKNQTENAKDTISPINSTEQYLTLKNIEVIIYKGMNAKEHIEENYDLFDTSIRPMDSNVIQGDYLREHLNGDIPFEKYFVKFHAYKPYYNSH